MLLPNSTSLKSILILLQSVPREICVKNLKNRIEKIEGIVKIHDLHVWRLQPDCIIGTVHLRIRGLPEGEEDEDMEDVYKKEEAEYQQEQTDYVEVARKVKAIFHENNIHCTTIQPEFEDGTTDNPEECLYDCGPDETCCPTTCCATQNQDPNDTSNTNNPKRLKNGSSSVTPMTVVVSPVEIPEVTISLRDEHQEATQDGEQ
nr:solute carrier family 30 (zinc transporter) [Hymenolepis microstoma]